MQHEKTTGAGAQICMVWLVSSSSWAKIEGFVIHGIKTHQRLFSRRVSAVA